jgi:hypothetical protein
VNLIPKEYLDRIFVFPINNYEELVSATSVAEKKLAEHLKKTGKYGWFINELLDENWRMAQDWYCREAYGVGLGEYFAQKRQSIKAVKEDASIFRSLEGWTDWPIIKWGHNYNWIDKIKRFPYNVLFTSEVKEEGNKESLFFNLGLRPAGEKDNLHRVDTIIYLSHKEDKFFMQCFKLTGYDRLYSSVDITSKNPYDVHRQILKKFEDAGYKSSAIEELEKEAGIPTPPKVEPKKEPQKTIEVVSKEGTTKISKEELKKEPKKEDIDWEMSL